MNERLLNQFNYFGVENQKRKLVEEVFELLEAINEFEKGIGSIEHCIEELADTENLLKQWQLHLEIGDEEVISERVDKAWRTDDRIRTGYYGGKK